MERNFEQHIIMAKFLIPILALNLLIILSALSSPAAAEVDFVRPVDGKLMDLKKEKLSHIRLYWHDVQSPQNRSSFTVIPPVNTTATAFGMVNMIDNALTLGPDLRSSKLVGRAQGFYAATSQEEVSLLMAMNLAFTEGEYSGSSLTLMGRNPVLNKGREMPVIGGSGLFRFATGYSNLTTYAFDLSTGNAVVEYNVYIKYYSSSSTRVFGLFISFLTLLIHFSLSFN